MSPPPPIPEHEFLQFLREHGCEGRPTAKDFAAFRISDGKLISTYAVKHPGKKEVKYCYKKNFLSRLKEMSAEDSEEEAPAVVGDVQQDVQNDWQNSDWYKEQERFNKRWNELQQLDEETS